MTSRGTPRGPRPWVVAGLIAALLGLPAAGQDVALTSRDGTLAVEGRLISHDGASYVVETEHGRLTLDAAVMACSGEGCPDAPRVVMEGAPEVAAVLMPALLRAHAARSGLSVEEGPSGLTLFDGRAEADLVLRATTSGAGLAALAEGRADAALVLRAPRAAERGAAEAAGLGAIDDPARTRVLALGALVPVVSPRSPVRALSLGEVAALLAGGDWPGVGAATVHLPEAGSGLGQAVEDLILAPAGLAAAPGAVRHADMRALVRAVARDPRAVGVAPLGEVGLAEPMGIRGACGLTIEPMPEAVRAGEWPLTLPVRMVLPAAPLPEPVRGAVAFALSPDAQGVVRRAGLVDQAPEPIPLAAQGERLAAAIMAAGPEVSLEELREMVGTLRGMTRLSPTFRFEGGVRLDAASREGVERLARRLAEGEHDGERLVLVGFGDGTGPASRNRVQGLRRAEAVAEALRARSGVELEVLSFGEALPVACDDEPWGRRLNRRVELWRGGPGGG